MGPKPKKPPAKKAKGGEAAGGGKSADCSLTRAAFEEDSWQVCLAMVVGSGPAEEELSRRLLAAVQQPIRAHFTPLTWDGLLDKLCEFNPKAKKAEAPSPFQEHAAVAEAARGLLDAGQDIPCDLLAKVVKCLLLQVKRVDQQRREGEQGLDGRAEEDGADEERTEKRSKLKRRGEVEVPAILDQPEDGPQLYILLFGFYHPLLIAALDDVGVHVSCVVRLCSEGLGQVERSEDEASGHAAEAPADLVRKLSHFWSELVPVLNSGTGSSRLPDVVQLSYTVQSHGAEAELETGIRMYGGVAALLYDCLEKRRQHQRYLRSTRLVSVPLVSRLPPPQPEVPPAAAPRAKKKGEVEEPAPKPKPEQQLSADVDMRYYWNLLDRVPPEACSVPLILHCMLEQVAVSAEEPPPEPDGPPESCRLDDPLVRFLLRRFLPQARSEEEQRSMQRRLLPGLSAAEKIRLRQTLAARPAQQQQPQQQPELVAHLDEAARRFLDVPAAQDFDPLQAERAMSRLHPARRLIQVRGQRGEGAPGWSGVKQHLQHFCTDDAVSWREVERFLHQSVFESMPLTRLGPDGVLERSSSLLGVLEAAQRLPVLPWDDPPAFASLQLKNAQAEGQTFETEDPDDTSSPWNRRPQPELVHLQSCRLRSLSHWRFSERHDAAVFSQVLPAVWDQFCCVDVFPGRLNNMVYVFCHNPTCPSRHSREFWDVGLHTDVRFRDYLEHVAETISDWTREEERKRAEEKARRLSPAERPEDLQTQLEEEPVIREGSLKARKLEQERLKEEEEEEEKTKRSKNEAKGKQQPAAAKTGSASSAAQRKANVETLPEPPEEDAAEPPEEAFVGLNTGGMLVHVSGRVHRLRPSDGGVVTVEDVRFAEASQLVKVVVEKDGHRFCTHVHHQAADLAKPPSPGPAEVLVSRGRRGSFTALLASGAQMSYSFYGPSGEAPVPTCPPDQVPEPAETPDQPPSKKAPRAPAEAPRAPEPEGPQDQHPFRTLSLSVPSGLLVQFQREAAEGVSWQQQGLWVKQSFPLSGADAPAQLPDLFLSDETFRTVSSAGDVIRHLRDGATQILFADGTVSFSSFSGADSEAERQSEEPAQKAEERKAAQRRSWITMTPGGERFHTVGNTHKRLPVTDLLVVKATDPVTGDVMLTREDRVVLVQRADGSRAVEHADGTRITSWFQDRPAAQGQSPVQEPARRPGSAPASTPERHGDEERPTPTGGPDAAPRPAQRGRERAVSVEKEGCAAVVMFPERRAAQVLLADGSVVTATNQGTYEARLADGASLQIDAAGTCLFVPGPAGGPASVYRMSHTDRVACDVTDPEGNRFQVTEDGATAASLGPDPEEQPHQEDLPRLFLVHGDGSALELLSPQTVEEVLGRACSDPAAALLREPLPDCPGEFGITVLKPGHRSLWSQWVLGKRTPDITPQNLRNRVWAGFPQTERKSPGQETSGGPGSDQPVRTRPEVLEIRQLYEHRPLEPVAAEAVDERLKDYLEALMNREQLLEAAEAEQPGAEHRTPAVSRTMSDLLALYERRRGTSAVQNLLADPGARDRKSRWRERLRRHRQELQEEKTLRAALRTRTCLPYFHQDSLSLLQNLVSSPKPALRRASVAPPPVLTSEAPEVLPETPPSPPPPDGRTPPRSVSRAAGTEREAGRSLLDAATQTSVGGAPKASSRRYRSVYEDVTGKPRKARVRLPVSVLGSSVGSAPNHKLLSEGSVRRRCRFGPRGPPRGFQLVPSRVDFGSLPDGGSASATVRMKNVGVDSCRFHVKQPPLKTGVRVLYTPGPVPAGLHVDLQVQLLAMAPAEGRQSRIHHDLVIQTELEILHLPVTANILQAPARAPRGAQTLADAAPTGP